MSIPVDISDLEGRFRPFVGDESTVAAFLLEDAWAVLLSTVPDLEARMTSAAVREDAVRAVVVAMALRVLRNPNGVKQWSVDDYSETRDGSVAAGTLYVSPEEIALLTGRANATRRGAFSVAPSGAASVPAPGAERDLAQLNDIRFGRFGPWG